MLNTHGLFAGKHKETQDRTREQASYTWLTFMHIAVLSFQSCAIISSVDGWISYHSCDVLFTSQLFNVTVPMAALLVLLFSDFWSVGDDELITRETALLWHQCDLLSQRQWPSCCTVTCAVFTAPCWRQFRWTKAASTDIKKKRFHYIKNRRL